MQRYADAIVDSDLAPGYAVTLLERKPNAKIIVLAKGRPHYAIIAAVKGFMERNQLQIDDSLKRWIPMKNGGFLNVIQTTDDPMHGVVGDYIFYDSDIDRDTYYEVVLPLMSVQSVRLIMIQNKDEEKCCNLCTLS